MNPKQSFIQSLVGNIKNLGKETYKAETIEDKYNKYSPELRQMIEAIANQESVNGMYREKKGDQRDGTSSYGLLHLGQGAVDEFNKRKGDYGYEGGDLKAKDLAGEDSDLLQKYIQASRIDRDMRVNGRDLYGATRYVQNYGDPNYATTTMNKYKNSIKANKDTLSLYPNAVRKVE